MGLLDRAGTIEQQGSPTNINPYYLAQKVLSEVPARAEGPDFPVYVFDTFFRVLKFSKAALLLLNDEASGFAPWLARGFDRTTIRRLHIPASFAGLHSNRVFFLSDTQQKRMEPMLSAREYGLNSDILFVGIGEGEIPTGVIIAAGFSDMAQNTKSIVTASELLANTFSPGLTRSRVWTRTTSPVDEKSFREWLEARGEQKSVLAVLDFSKTVRLLEKGIPGIEPFYIQKDLVSILRNFTGRMGRIREIANHQAAILFPWERLLDHDLFIHQLNHAFSTAFSLLSRNTGITASFYDWPGERESVEKILSDYF